MSQKVCKVQKDDFCENNSTKTQNELYTITNYRNFKLDSKWKKWLSRVTKIIIREHHEI